MNSKATFSANVSVIHSTPMQPQRQWNFALGLAAYYDNLPIDARREVVLAAMPWLRNMAGNRPLMLAGIVDAKLEDLRSDQQWHLLTTLAFGALNDFRGV